MGIMQHNGNFIKKEIGVKMIIFCLTYAGGTTNFYDSWLKYNNSEIRFCPIEYKGRGKRKNEGFYENFEELINDIIGKITDEIEEDYCIFGHSFGALVAYEVCMKLQKLKMNMPVKIYISAKGEPSVLYSCPVDNDVDLIKYVEYINPSSEAIFDNYRISSLYLNRLKNDYLILNQYKFCHLNDKLKIPICILYSKSDVVIKSPITNWNNYTDSYVEFYAFEGGHFYINDKSDKVIRIIKKTLLNNC